MPITFSCPNPDCPRIFSVKDEFAGRTSICPDCGTSIIVPANQAAPVPVPLPPPPAPKEVFCTNCGSTVSEQAVACMSCGARPTGHKKFCRQCGVGLNPEQVVCVKCGVSLTSGGFSIGGILGTTSANTNQKPPLLPIILAGILVLLFFTPQLIVKFHASSRSYGGFMGGFYDSEVDETVLIWGWNSWFGILTLVLGGLILAGKVAEYSLPNINKFPQQFYSGLYGIVVFCLIIGFALGYFGGYGIWFHDSGKSISLKEAFEMIKNQDRHSTMLVFPATVILALGVSFFGIFQSWLLKVMTSRSCIFGMICFVMMVPYLFHGIQYPLAIIWILTHPTLLGIINLLCLIISVFGVVMGHRILKTNKTEMAKAIFLCCVVCCLIHLLCNLYWLSVYLYNIIYDFFFFQLDAAIQLSGLLCLIALILGVFFGHRELKSIKAKSAKVGLQLCWIACLIYVIFSLTFPNLGNMTHTAVVSDPQNQTNQSEVPPPPPGF